MRIKLVGIWGLNILQIKTSINNNNNKIFCETWMPIFFISMLVSCPLDHITCVVISHLNTIIASKSSSIITFSTIVCLYSVIHFGGVSLIFCLYNTQLWNDGGVGFEHPSYRNFYKKWNLWLDTNTQPCDLIY